MPLSDSSFYIAAGNLRLLADLPDTTPMVQEDLEWQITRVQLIRHLSRLGAHEVFTAHQKRMDMPSNVRRYISPRDFEALELAGLLFRFPGREPRYRVQANYPRDYSLLLHR